MVSNIITILCFFSFIYGLVKFDVLYYLPAMIWGAFHSLFVLNRTIPLWSAIAYGVCIVLLISGASCLIALHKRGAYIENAYRAKSDMDKKFFSAGRWLVMAGALAYVVGYAGIAMN